MKPDLFKESRARAASAPELGRQDYAKKIDDESDSEVEPDEALTPTRARSMSTVRTRPFTRDHQEEGMAGVSAPETDMEAAMMLLGFMKGSGENGQTDMKDATMDIAPRS